MTTKSLEMFFIIKSSEYKLFNYIMVKKIKMYA